MNTTPSVIIAQATHPHEAGIAAFLLRNDCDAVRRNFHPFPLNSTTAHEIVNAPRNEFFLVACSNETVVGIAMLRGRSQGYTIPSFGILVDHSAKGRGVGRLLLRAALRSAAAWDCAFVRLTVFEDNIVALHFYSTYGFVEHSRSTEATDWGPRVKIVMLRPTSLPIP